MSSPTCDLHPGRLPDGLRPQPGQGGRRYLRAAGGVRLRRARRDERSGAGHRGRSRRQPGGGAVLRPGTARRHGRRRPPGLREPSHRPPRGRMCIGQRRGAGRDGRHRVWALRRLAGRRRRADEERRRADRGRASRLRGLGGSRGAGRPLSVARSVQRDRRRLRRSLGSRVRAPGTHRGGQLRQRRPQPERPGPRLAVRGGRLRARRRAQSGHRGTAAKAGLRPHHRRGRRCRARRRELRAGFRAPPWQVAGATALDTGLGPPHGTDAAGGQAAAERGLAVSVRAPARGDHRRLPPRRHRRARSNST